MGRWNTSILDAPSLGTQWWADVASALRSFDESIRPVHQHRTLTPAL